MKIEDKLDQIIENQKALIDLQRTLIKVNGNRSFLKVKEAALIFEVGKKLLYQAIRNKEIKAYRPNSRDFLLKAEEVEEWIMKKQV